MNEVVMAFWFFLAAGIANMSPVLAKRIPLLRRWKTPIDLGGTWRGRRLLGDNKTWRGLLFGTLMGAVTYVLVFRFHGIAFGPENLLMAAIVGGLLGFGALAGDAIESFFKRQLDIRPGRPWFPFDQIDYIIGGLVAIYPLLQPSLSFMGIILALYFGLHLIASYVGYLLGLKDSPI